MSDTFSKKKRSEIMRAVKSRGNKSTELRFISILRNFKITGWRRNYKITGNPDFVFPNKKLAIFIDGCFWHGHNCRNLNPSSNKKYWQQKIGRNRARDRFVNKSLSGLEWKVIRIWECEIKECFLPRKMKSLF